MPPKPPGTILTSQKTSNLKQCPQKADLWPGETKQSQAEKDFSGSKRQAAYSALEDRRASCHCHCGGKSKAHHHLICTGFVACTQFVLEHAVWLFALTYGKYPRKILLLALIILGHKPKRPRAVMRHRRKDSALKAEAAVLPQSATG
eukprot:3080880-Rhodomonas_salina.1